MFGILVFLFLLSLLLTHFNYRLSLFMFPDGVYINKFQGFLGWYGFTNLFVSIPFLWDGDFKQGVFPFVLGVVPLIIAIISVFRLNTNVNVQYRRGLKVLSNADANMKLSERRAQAVADELVRLGVNPQRIEVVAAGGVDTLTPAEYNRRATVELK